MSTPQCCVVSALLGPCSLDRPYKYPRSPEGWDFTYLLPLLSPHLPFLFFISLIPYEDLLDPFWSVLGTKGGKPM